MDITFMGTSCAAGSVSRDNTYLLLRHERKGWLIDVGGNPLGKLKMASVSLDEIEGVVLTHFHVDHIYGLPSLLWGMWIEGRKNPLTICCPGVDEDQLRAILAAYQVNEWPVAFDIRIQTFDWTKETTLIDGNAFSLSTFPSLHARPTVGIRVMQQGKVLIYSADTRLNEWIRKQEHIDLLIHEATNADSGNKSHTGLRELLGYYPLERIGRLFAVHLTDGQPYEDVLAQLDETTRAKITLASDGMTATL
jgi:ribonuclease Z